MYIVEPITCNVNSSVARETNLWVEGVSEPQPVCTTPTAYGQSLPLSAINVQLITAICTTLTLKLDVGYWNTETTTV